jgi:hypothetical protein
MKVTVWGPNLGTRGASMHVHRPGCADTTRGIYRRLSEAERGWTVEVESTRDVVFAVYPPDQFDYDEADWENYLGEFKFFPCVPNLDKSKVEPRPAPESAGLPTGTRVRARTYLERREPRLRGVVGTVIGRCAAPTKASPTPWYVVEWDDSLGLWNHAPSHLRVDRTQPRRQVTVTVIDERPGTALPTHDEQRAEFGKVRFYEEN